MVKGLRGKEIGGVGGKREREKEREREGEKGKKGD